MIDVFLPYRGEFGHKVMWHAPWVNACESEKIICCEKGEEALYPNATKYIYSQRKNDADKREYSEFDARYINKAGEAVLDLFTPETRANLKLRTPPPKHPGPKPTIPLKYFVPRPYTEVPDIDVDIAICPRYREYGEDRNWAMWPKVVEWLQSEGFKVASCGAPDSSVKLPCTAAWDLSPNYLDATLAIMHKAKFVLTTDCGLAHLTLACGKPLLMICYQGRGGPKSSQIKDWRFTMENHKSAPIVKIENGWESFDDIKRAVKGYYRHVSQSSNQSNS